MACLGGLFTVFPAVTSMIFGSEAGSILWSFLFLGFALSNVGAFLLSYFFLEKILFAGMLWVCFGCSAGALVTGLLTKEKNIYA